MVFWARGTFFSPPNSLCGRKVDVLSQPRGFADQKIEFGDPRRGFLIQQRARATQKMALPVANRRSESEKRIRR
jgi:hypothetical protein